MSAQAITLILYLILTVLYLPLIVTLYRRPAGQENAAILLGIYIALASVFTLFEGLYRAGELYIATPQVANDFQIYGALFLSFLLTLAVLSFIRRRPTVWLGLGLFWVLGLLAILPNINRFGDVIWQSGNFLLTRERLAPTWAMLGWLIFTLGGFFNVRSAHNNSRQPLLRNRLNYWTPVFLLVIINDSLIMAGIPFPGNPMRLAAAVLATFVIVTHDPPDLREVARRVVIYLITALVIATFYIAAFTAWQTVFNALPNYSPLLVGAGIAILLALLFTPLLTVVQRWVNRWLNVQEYHATSRTLHAYSEQISNILDMQRLANVAVGLIIEAMDITRGFLFLVDSETPVEGRV